MRDEDNATRYFSFDLPKPTDGSYDADFEVNRVVLCTDNIRDQFDCEYHHYLQGAACRSKLIYSLEGFTDDPVNPPALRIIDSRRKMLKEKYLLSQFGLNAEPELIDFDGDICYYSDNLGNLYQLLF